MILLNSDISVKYLVSKIIKKIQIPAIRKSIIDRTSRICPGSHIVEVELGKYSYIGNYCTVINTKIGSFSSIADNCIIGGASHPIAWVSTSPVFHEGRNILNKNFSNHEFNTRKDTIIGNDVWVGNNCLIKSGVIIGDGAVIGMGSVVTKNIEPYSIVAGNPAKLIRKRFDNEIIGKLQEIKWWNYDDSKLEQKAMFFNDIEKFIQES